MQEYLDLVLISSIIFAIFGISWQLMRLLGKTTEVMEEFKQTNVRINGFMDKVEDDYHLISSTIRGVTATIDKVNEEIIKPVSSIANVFHAIENVFDGIKTRVKKESEPDDYLPEE